MYEEYNKLWYQCRDGAISYIKSLQCGKPWLIRHSKVAQQPIAICSATAILMLSFLDAIDQQLSADQKQTWLEYLQGFQSDDGLCEDRIDMAEPNTQGYPLWALKAHRTRHIAWGIEALGGRMLKPIEFVKPFMEPGKMEQWVSRLWSEQGENIWALGNWIMDMAVLLDIQHRHFSDPQAKAAIIAMLNELNSIQDPDSGYWLVEGVDLRRTMAGAMHWYPIYWANSLEVPHYKKAVATTLSLQQPDGLFGFESGQGGCQCLDYDAMLILRNGYSLIAEYRHEIKNAAGRLMDSIMVNRNADGSFADTRVDELRYWTTKAAAYNASQGSIWDTYARLMTIAMAIEIITDQSPRPMQSGHHLFDSFSA